MPQAHSMLGFLDAMANKFASLGVGLTKGVNLFAEALVDDPDRVTDHVTIYDEGYAQLEDVRHDHVNWNVGFATLDANNGLAAVEQLRPLISAILSDKHRFVVTSDAGERYQIIAVRVVTSPVVAEKTDSGSYLARAVVQFQVIPD